MCPKDGRALIFFIIIVVILFKCSVFLPPYLPTIILQSLLKTPSCGLYMTFGSPGTTTKKFKRNQGIEGTDTFDIHRETTKPTKTDELILVSLLNAKIQLSAFCALYRHVLGGTMFSGMTADIMFLRFIVPASIENKPCSCSCSLMILQLGFYPFFDFEPQLSTLEPQSLCLSPG